MKKRWDVYTAMCTQLMDSSPAGCTHQHMHGVLHQSDGGRSSADQPQRRALTRVWSEPHQGLNKLKTKGETNFTISGNFKRRGRSAKWGILDFASKEILSLEDTAGKKIHLEPVTTGNIRSKISFR